MYEGIYQTRRALPMTARGRGPITGGGGGLFWRGGHPMALAGAGIATQSRRIAADAWCLRHGTVDLTPQP